MPRRRIRFTPTTEVAEGFDAIRREAGVELECPPEVVAEASGAAAASGRGGVGERRLALERARGGVRLNVPEQEVVRDPSGGWTVDYRVPLPSEDWNAQISLLTGMAAATLMLGAGVGILRVQPPPSDKALLRLRRASLALGV